MRCPEQFKGMLTGQLSEDVGEKMARWALGAPQRTLAETLALVRSAATQEALKNVAAEAKASPWNEAERASIGDAIKTRQNELRGGAVPPAQGEQSDGKNEQQ
jgi:hypothetical protein